MRVFPSFFETLLFIFSFGIFSQPKIGFFFVFGTFFSSLPLVKSYWLPFAFEIFCQVLHSRCFNMTYLQDNMIHKRPFIDEGTDEVAFKHPRHWENTNHLSFSEVAPLNDLHEKLSTSGNK